MVIEKLKSEIKKLELNEGNIIYEDFGGNGETILCLPSLGDIRQEYRFLVTILKEKGYRVITMDLRGHGDSDTSFSSYSADNIADDIIALLEKLAIKKVNLIGCSISGGAIASVSARRSDLVNKIIMINPFAREMPNSNFIITIGKILLTRPWGVFVWGLYYKSLYPTFKPNDFSNYLTYLKNTLAKKERLEATIKMFSASKKNIESLLNKVTQDNMIIMGEKDIDFSNPLAEAELLSSMLGKKAIIKVLDKLGHYPHAENPEITGKLILDFLEGKNNV
ncbi:MAG: alpha/beta hydrolase [Candidatus Sericytochromatia bacterium]